MNAIFPVLVARSHLMQNITKTFGLVLSDLRRHRKFSQETLAEKSELHRTYVSQLERGLRQPSLQTILRLSNALGIAPSKFIAAVEKKVGIK
jgi:transcriptional regulator with XRE-family HTH domain